MDAGNCRVPEVIALVSKYADVNERQAELNLVKLRFRQKGLNHRQQKRHRKTTIEDLDTLINWARILDAGHCRTPEVIALLDKYADINKRQAELNLLKLKIYT